uniref:Uncharacterized protein n=1 Tax=Ciona intestinalis TaxID=7719 RepID=H2Y354_CIOIN
MNCRYMVLRVKWDATVGLAVTLLSNTFIQVCFFTKQYTFFTACVMTTVVLLPIPFSFYRLRVDQMSI